jgi:hypothetical protein
MAMTITTVRFGFNSLLLAASIFSTAALAQDKTRPLPSRNEIVLPCCRCIDGKVTPIDVSTGTAPWQVNSSIPGAMGSFTPGAISNPHPAWTATAALAPAKWLQPSTSTTMQNFQNGFATYTLKIRVQQCTIPQKVTISGKLAGDDVAFAYIDNPGSPASTATINLGGGANFPLTGIKSINGTLGTGPFTAPGVYTLRVVMQNTGQGPAAIILNGQITSVCKDRYAPTDTRPVDTRAGTLSEAVSL